MSFEHITKQERKKVNECMTESEANREVGLLLVDEIRELNTNLYKIAVELESKLGGKPQVLA